MATLNGSSSAAAAGYGAIELPDGGPSPSTSTSTSTCTSSNANAAQPQQPASAVLSTYAAGEDAGRLAALAREFGLEHTRAPRAQVRARAGGAKPLEGLRLWAERVVALDESYLDMRYRASYRAARIDELSSDSDSDGEVGLLLGKLPRVGEGEEEASDEDEGGDEALEDPHAAGLGGSLPSAALGIVKGMVGPAILYLPHGFASAGYLVAIPVLMLSTVLFLWSSGCLLECWRAESERVNRKLLAVQNGNGSNIPRRIALSYPELAYRAFGSKGERVVQVGISLMQSGVCLTYLIFVPQNLRASALLLFGWDVSTTWMLVLMVLVQIPLSWIRDIRRLTVTNLLANVLILYGLITCLGFAVGNVSDGAEGTLLNEAIARAHSLPAFNPSGWFLFFGTSVLLFEGSITLLVPLQEAVQTESDRRKFPTMYRKVILGIVSFYAFFGMACWMAFGNDVRTVMTTSLPPGTMATTVQLAYSLAVVFTFPLQNFPSLEIVSASVEKILGGGEEKRGSALEDASSRRNVISTLLVVVLALVALLTMNDLDKVVSLMGSLLGIPLAFVLPPLIQNRLDKGQLGDEKKLVNVAVATLGAGAMAVSSTTTILNWD